MLFACDFGNVLVDRLSWFGVYDIFQVSYALCNTNALLVSLFCKGPL